MIERNDQHALGGEFGVERDRGLPGECADLQTAGDADRRDALEVRAHFQRDICQRNALGAEGVLPGAQHGGEEGDAVGHHPDTADEFQRAVVDGDVDRSRYRNGHVLRVRNQFELRVLEYDAVGDRDVADAGGERQVAELGPDVGLDVQLGLDEELVGAEAGQVEPAVDQQPTADPGTGDRLQLVEGERGVVEGGDDDQRIGQVHAVQSAEGGRQRGEFVGVVQGDPDCETPGCALPDDRLHPLESGPGGREGCLGAFDVDGQFQVGQAQCQ